VNANVVVLPLPSKRLTLLMLVPEWLVRHGEKERIGPLGLGVAQRPPLLQ
jgi:hypothetical protein